MLKPEDGEANIAVGVPVVVVRSLGVAVGDELLVARRLAVVERRADRDDGGSKPEPVAEEVLRKLRVLRGMPAELGQRAERDHPALVLGFVVEPAMLVERDVEAVAAAPLRLDAVVADFVAERGKHLAGVAETAPRGVDVCERVKFHEADSFSEAISCMAVCLGRVSETARESAHPSPTTWHSHFARVTAV